MFDIKKFINCIFSSKLKNFDELALDAFHYQYNNNDVYNEYCKLVGVLDNNTIKNLSQIPFIPIEFFKNKSILLNQKKSEIIFESSGETKSKHFVADIEIYKKSFFKGFELFYGDIETYCFLALLPSYLERENSSLVYMCKQLITTSKHKLSGFYLNEFDNLKQNLMQLKAQNQKTILLGATFALLDFVEEYSIDFPELIVMETGGMKGRRKEITRPEVHEYLKKSFRVSNIHSEYGMTEMLSQAYAKQDGKFESPPWVKVFTTEINDVFSKAQNAKNGIINVIDLANIYSCCFLKTSDIGKVFDDETFEVLGRLDNSDLRGCSLLTI